MPAGPALARRRAAGAALAVVLAVGALLTAAPTPAGAVDVPSWPDVQNARADEAQTRAMADRLAAALDAAQERAATTSHAALAAASAATAARAAADAATARSAALGDALADAEERLAVARGRVGAFASRLARAQTDGPLIAQLLTSADADGLLGRLALLDKLSGTWTGIAGDAQRDALATQSLQAQASDAESARVAAAEAAERTASEAQAAADAEGALVADVQAQAATLYAQLATLKNTTADVEQRYRLGRQVAAQPAPVGSGTAGGADGSTAPGGSSGSGGSGGSSGSGGGSGGSNPGDGGTPTYGVSVDPAGAKAYARGAIGAYGWGDDQYTCLVQLWNRESGWRANALNPSSGAYGIPQALPAGKMAAAGADWRTNGNTQVNWGLSYIRSRYGSPCGAWDHSQRTGWY